MPQLTKEIREFITDNFLFGQTGQLLDDDDSLLENGIIDSTGVLELIGFIERTYRIKVGDADLVPDNLDSISRLVDFIESKRTPKEAPASSAVS